jgi:hypothetical protein
MDNRIISIKINKWSDLFILCEKLDLGFIFRGQSDSEWSLSSSLERAIIRFSPDWVKFNLLSNKEHWMLYEFRRKYQLYSQLTPDYDNNFEWFAIMQHHGAPTRLLDFTHPYSPSFATRG